MQFTFIDSEDPVAERKIVGVCWGPGQPATALVLTDESGRILGSPLYCSSLSGHAKRAKQPDQLQYNPMEDPVKVPSCSAAPARLLCT